MRWRLEAAGAAGGSQALTFFTGKLAFITGGSSGIGLELGRQLTAAGADVLLLARDRTKLERALAAVERERAAQVQKLEIAVVDVTDFEQVTGVVDRLQARSGSPDLVINNAGAAHPGYVEALDVDIFRWMMEVNYFGTVHMTKAVLPGLLEKGSGHILNVSSIAGFLGVYGYTAYGASKFAVRGFSDALRAEMRPKGIKVSILYPPDTETPQLHYENRFKPPETKALAGSASVMSAEQVAKTALRGVRRGRYVIIPGWEGKLLYWLAGAAGTLAYPIMDWMLTRTSGARTAE